MFLWKQDGSKVCTFGLTLTIRFPLKMVRIEKNKSISWKTSAIGLSKYGKIKALSPLLFTGKIQLLFVLFGLFLAGNRTFKSRNEILQPRKSWAT